MSSVARAGRRPRLGARRQCRHRREEGVLDAELHHGRRPDHHRTSRSAGRAYGTLNAARDNVIIVPHFFTGNSHAAGKYKAEDAAPGYWDAIIGPGKPIDTDKFYVVSVDTLVNLNTKDPNTTTTGPATINPATGKP